MRALKLAAMLDLLTRFCKVSHMPKSQTLGQFIQQRRRELALTQEALANRLGDTVRQSDVSRLERDRIRLPRRDRLEQLATALEVSLGDLLARSGWMMPGDQLEQELDRSRLAPPEILRVPLSANPEDIQALVTVIEDAQALIAATQEALAAADATLRHTLSTLSPSGERAPIHLPRGVIRQWETSAVMAV